MLNGTLATEKHASHANQMYNICGFFNCIDIETFWAQFELNAAYYGIRCENSLTLADICGKFKQVKYDMLNRVILHAKYNL